MYQYSGQRCTAVKVILAMECIADQLVCKVNSKIQKLTVGSPEDDCDITPVISETSANFIEGLVQDAKCKGARFHQVKPRITNPTYRPHTLCWCKPQVEGTWKFDSKYEAYVFAANESYFCCTFTYLVSLQEWRREGNLIWPILIDHVRPDMRIAWEEPFGPILPCIRIKTVEEGIHHCNANNFALQVTIFSFDLQ